MKFMIWISRDRRNEARYDPYREKKAKKKKRRLGKSSVPYGQSAQHKKKIKRAASIVTTGMKKEGNCFVKIWWYNSFQVDERREG